MSKSKTNELLTHNNEQEDVQNEQILDVLEESEKEQPEESSLYAAPIRMSLAASSEAPPFNNGPNNHKKIDFFQRAYGNFATLRYHNDKYPIQAKLKVGQPNDSYEQEADRVAEQVLRMSDGHISQLSEKEQGRKLALFQAKPDSTFSLPSSHRVAKTIQSRGSGSPLPHHVREKAESILGNDLSHVRVHNETIEHATAKSIRAMAFTHANHIWLGSGQSADDTALMAHELTHVVQQGAGFAPTVMRKPDADQSSVESYYHDLNGRSMDDMLRILLGSGSDVVTEMYGRLHEARGVNVGRIRIAMLAVMMPGNPVSFSLTYQRLIEALPLDQRLDVLRAVGGSGWRPPRTAEPGDKVMTKAVLYPTEIRVRTGPALTWQSNNPGALTYITGQYGFYVLDFEAYPGKRNGILAIFPTQTAGYLALLHWMSIFANETIIGFTKKHAPASHGGNRPIEYAEYIVQQCGLPAASIYARKLGSLSQPSVAGAIMSQEGWAEGKVMNWDDPDLPPEVRFRLMYTRWLESSTGD